MKAPNQTQHFNLKAVVQETGLKADTLRAWERRYGLPQPQRTAGRHRLYSRRDIDMLKWLIARQEQGLSISRAIALWRETEEEGRDPLRDPEFSIQASSDAPVVAHNGATITELRAAWLTACLAFDEPSAILALGQAFALFSAETVCFEILGKSLAAIGEDWYADKISVQQEHFASELSTRRLEAMLTAAPPPTRGDRILVGCAPDDEHTFAPLLLTFMLRQRGWDVVFLGARVPAAQMDSTILAAEPQAVILTAQQLSSAATLLDVSQLCALQQVALGFGGRVFNVVPELRQRIPGLFLGERLEGVPPLVEKLLSEPPSPAPTISVSRKHREALSHFLERRLKLEASVRDAVPPAESSASYWGFAFESLSKNIIAALKLGDMEYLEADIDWLWGLLVSRGVTREVLQRFFEAYGSAAAQHLDERGSFVTQWLANTSLNGFTQKK